MPEKIHILFSNYRKSNIKKKILKDRGKKCLTYRDKNYFQLLLRNHASKSRVQR